MATIGEMLKQARENKGITLEKAEEETKVRAKYLAALEDEEYDVIPGKVYVKGFLKIYAGFLGLDEKEITDQYATDATSIAEKPAAKETNMPKETNRPTENRKYSGPNRYVRKRNESKWLNYVVMAVLAAAAVTTLVFFNSHWGSNKKADENQPPQAGVGQQNPEDNKPEPTENQGGQNTPAVPNVETPPDNVPGTEGTAGENSQQANVDGVQLLLKTNDQECWIKVVADGRTIFTGTLSAGESKTFDAKEQIRLVLGNAGAVEVTHNGENLGILGPIGKVVKKEFTKSM